MKYLLMAIISMSMTVFSSMSLAREVSFKTVMNSYGGKGAYLAFYLTDQDGQYIKTLWVAGQKAKYYNHLSGWARGSRLFPGEYDAVTGASMSRGMMIKITLNVDDQYIDSGLILKIDSSVEHMRDYRDDVIVPFTAEHSGIAKTGKGFIKSFTFTF